MDGWNTTFLLGRSIFRGYVSFREGKLPTFHSMNPSFFFLFQQTQWGWFLAHCSTAAFDKSWPFLEQVGLDLKKQKQERTPVAEKSEYSKHSNFGGFLSHQTTKTANPFRRSVQVVVHCWPKNHQWWVMNHTVGPKSPQTVE